MLVAETVDEPFHSVQRVIHLIHLRLQVLEGFLGGDISTCLHGIILQESSDVKQLLYMFCVLIIFLVDAKYIKFECLKVR